MASLLSADGYALNRWTSGLSWFKNSQGVGRIVSGNGEKVEREVRRRKSFSPLPSHVALLLGFHTVFAVFL